MEKPTNISLYELKKQLKELESRYQIIRGRL